MYATLCELLCGLHVYPEKLLIWFMIVLFSFLYANRIICHYLLFSQKQNNKNLNQINKFWDLQMKRQNNIIETKLFEEKNKLVEKELECHINLE